MAARAQNLLILMSDEHDPRYSGAYGHPFVRTPNIDRLAARGARFANAYTPSPICVPARAAAATGSYVHRIGYWDNALAYDGRVPSWGHALQAAGLRVESIGKLHYRDAELATGFDRQLLPMHVASGHGMVWASVRDPLPRIQPKQRMLGAYIGAGESSYTRFDRTITARAVEWLSDAAARPAREPWVLFVGLVAPHFPLVAPQEFVDLYPLSRVPQPKLHPRTGYRRHPWVQALYDYMPDDALFADEAERVRAAATYYALCSYLDGNVGRILDALDREGLAATTRVIYTSDHGDNLGARGLWGKSTLYEEAVRVPLILAGADIPACVETTPVSLVDLYPTVLDAVGAVGAMASDRPGKSLLHVIGSGESERVVLSEYHAVGAASGAFMVRRGRWKYHHYVGFAPELFDLAHDPEELVDRAAEPACADIRREMRAVLAVICDPEAVDAAAKARQAALVESFGGRARALEIGGVGATPVPAA